MSRPVKPAAVMEAEGNPSHLSKAQLEARKAAEASFGLGMPEPPRYLRLKSQRKAFENVAKMLLDAGIATEMDGDCIGRYVLAREQWVDATELLRKVTRADPPDLSAIGQASRFQDSAFRQVRASASDLGLTIDARCRLVAPPRAEEPENRFARFAGGEAPPDGS